MAVTLRVRVAVSGTVIELRKGRNCRSESEPKSGKPNNQVMFNVLISGKLSKPPKLATGRNGQPYCTASIRVPVQGQREDEPDAVFASVIAFGEDAEKLGRLLQGDAVSVSGSARLSQWEKEGRAMTGLNVTATAILSAYDLRKRRGEIGGQNSMRTNRPNPPGSFPQQAAIFDAGDDFDDELSF